MCGLRTELRTEHLLLAPGGQALIEDLNWRVATGEFWCILGQNGVGKTCLLQALRGVVPPTAGKILLGEAPLDAWPAPQLAAQIGFMPQQQVDSAPASALAAVLAGRTSCRGAGAVDDEDAASAEAALAAVGLAHKAQMDVFTLSAGERQRVALAALLAQAPPLMLLDEPVAHQDGSRQSVMMRFIRELAARHAVVSSCHDIDLAARFATHVLVLAEGRHWLGTVEEVLTVDILQQAFECRFELQEKGGVRSFIPC